MTGVMEGQMTIFDLDTWYGKMSPVPYPQTMAKISEPSLKKPQGSLKKLPLFLNLRGGGGTHQAASWEMGGALLGEYTMQSFGESPSVGVESALSLILEENPHPKYSLSKKACLGILRRVEKAGRVLPEELMDALLRQSR